MERVGHFRLHGGKTTRPSAADACIINRSPLIMSPHRLFPDGARVVALIVALAGVSTQARAETPPSCTPANQA